MALDPDYYDYENGQSIFIPSTVGLKIPGTNQVHDGVWVVHDIGGAIEGARIDLYTGDMHWRTALGYFKNKDNFVSPEEALQNRPELQQLIEQRQHFSERSRLGDPKLLVDLFFI